MAIIPNSIFNELNKKIYDDKYINLLLHVYKFKDLTKRKENLFSIYLFTCIQANQFKLHKTHPFNLYYIDRFIKEGFLLQLEFEKNDEYNQATHALINLLVNNKRYEDIKKLIPNQNLAFELPFNHKKEFFNHFFNKKLIITTKTIESYFNSYPINFKNEDNDLKFIEDTCFIFNHLYKNKLITDKEIRYITDNTIINILYERLKYNYYFSFFVSNQFSLETKRHLQDSKNDNFENARKIALHHLLTIQKDILNNKNSNKIIVKL